MGMQHPYLEGRDEHPILPRCLLSLLSFCGMQWQPLEYHCAYGGLADSDWAAQLPSALFVYFMYSTILCRYLRGYLRAIICLP